jgi:hypothetical protein
MIAGHFGLAAGVKAGARTVPLWALMLACQWLDVIFVPLFGAKIETIVPVPGTSGGFGQIIIHADWTHSLVGALVLSALFATFGGIKWGRRAAIVLGAVAFSHWVLDLIVHRADLPLLPGGGGPHLGFGLWRWPIVTFALELMLVLGGGWLYARAARSTGDRRANLAGGLVIGSGLLTLGLNYAGL